MPSLLSSMVGVPTNTDSFPLSIFPIWQSHAALSSAETSSPIQKQYTQIPYRRLLNFHNMHSLTHSFQYCKNTSMFQVSYTISSSSSLTCVSAYNIYHWRRAFTLSHAPHHSPHPALTGTSQTGKPSNLLTPHHPLWDWIQKVQTTHTAISIRNSSRCSSSPLLSVTPFLLLTQLHLTLYFLTPPPSTTQDPRKYANYTNRTP